MGTPIQQFVKSVLSPKGVSKNLFKSPKSPFNSPSIRLKPPSPNFTKSHFHNSPNFDDLGISPIYENKKYDDSKIKIRCDFYENDKKIPYFNTPERKKILKFGICSKNAPVLGKGSFGTVIKGLYQGEVVAVKIVRTNLKSFLREQNCLNLKHKNLVEILNITHEPLSDFGIIFMKNYTSKNLQNVLEDSNLILSKKDTYKCISDVAQGLKYCHENNILHLDIKPKNILVCEDICRICDFGNSFNLKTENPFEYIFMGTVAYTAPEIFKGDIFDTKADVYSLGITMWQMESRKNPYSQIDNSDTVIYEVVKNGLRPNFEKTNLSKLFQKCWAQNPNLRPDCNSVISELDILLKNL